jgi:hypothetical protein
VKSLLERVSAFVAANPDSTQREIARGIQARDVEVRDVLADSAFSVSVRDEGTIRAAQLYRLALVGTDGLGRRARRSQNDLIQHVLQDGSWHTVSEIHRRCGFSRLNSRVSELRKKRGMLIECRHVDGAGRGPTAYEYRFTGFLDGFGPSEATDTLTGSTAVRSGESVASDGPAQRSPAVPLLTEHGSSDSQLGIGEAA